MRLTPLKNIRSGSFFFKVHLVEVWVSGSSWLRCYPLGRSPNNKSQTTTDWQRRWTTLPNWVWMAERKCCKKVEEKRCRCSDFAEQLSDFWGTLFHGDWPMEKLATSPQTIELWGRGKVSCKSSSSHLRYWSNEAFCIWLCVFITRKMSVGSKFSQFMEVTL